MSFIKLMAKNPFRNRARLALSVIGIAIGIATIVALGMVTDGLKLSVEEQLKTGGADFVVVKNTTSESSSGSETINEKRVDEISKMNGVKQAAGVSTSRMIVSGDQLNLAGVNSKDLNLLGAKITQGKAFSADDKNELILGKLASDKLKKKAGDTVTLNGNKYTITGIFETGNVNLDSIGALPLKNSKKWTKKREKYT